MAGQKQIQKKFFSALSSTEENLSFAIFAYAYVASEDRCGGLKLFRAEIVLHIRIDSMRLRWCLQ